MEADMRVITLKETGMEKVNNFLSMKADMKESSKTVNSMDKVT